MAPEGEIYLVPFFALRDPDGSLWADDTIRAVRVLHSGRALIPSEDEGQAEPHGLLALGDIDYGGNEMGRFRALHETREEVLAIEALAEAAGESAKAIFGTDATEQVLTGLAAPPRHLHLATHGFTKMVPTRRIDRLS